MYNNNGLLEISTFMHTHYYCYKMQWNEDVLVYVQFKIRLYADW